jgi:hypothetical protein
MYDSVVQLDKQINATSGSNNIILFIFVSLCVVAVKVELIVEISNKRRLKKIL